MGGNGSHFFDTILGDDEPAVDINIYPNTATVSLDTHKANILPVYEKMGVKPNNEVYANASYVASRFIASNKEGNNSASIIDQINAMSGCARHKYFGDFGVDPEYGFHTGNMLLPMRIFVDASGGGTNYRVIDGFFKLPEGLSFVTNNWGGEILRLVDYITELFSGLYWFSALNIYANGGDATAIPGAGDWYGIGDDPIKCTITGDNRLAFYIDTTVISPGYTVTFRLLDHPNAIWSRGAFISGTGYLSTRQSETNTYYAYNEQVIAPLTYTDAKIPAASYIDPDEGIVSSGLFIITVLATKYRESYYIAPHVPGLVDSRYIIVNIPEVTYDAKMGILTNQKKIDFTTVGIQLKGFTQQRFREHGEDDVQDYVVTNPTTNLSSTCSNMSLQVERKNEYGELLLPGMVPFAYPSTSEIAAWPAGTDVESVTNLFSSNILKNCRAVFSDNPAVPASTTFDTQYIDNGVRVNTSERFVHFSLNYMD